MDKFCLTHWQFQYMTCKIRYIIEHYVGRLYAQIRSTLIRGFMSNFVCHDCTEMAYV